MRQWAETSKKQRCQLCFRFEAEGQARIYDAITHQFEMLGICEHCAILNDVFPFLRGVVGSSGAAADASGAAMNNERLERAEGSGMKIYNFITGDKGQKSVPVMTLFYDESRKAVLSGELCIDAVKEALKGGNVKAQQGNAKGRFAGKEVIRVAGFPALGKKKEEGKKEDW